MNTTEEDKVVSLITEAKKGITAPYASFLALHARLASGELASLCGTGILSPLSELFFPRVISRSVQELNNMTEITAEGFRIIYKETLRAPLHIGRLYSSAKKTLSRHL